MKTSVLQIVILHAYMTIIMCGLIQYQYLPRQGSHCTYSIMIASSWQQLMPHLYGFLTAANANLDHWLCKYTNKSKCTLISLELTLTL